MHSPTAGQDKGRGRKFIGLFRKRPWRSKSLEREEQRPLIEPGERFLPTFPLPVNTPKRRRCGKCANCLLTSRRGVRKGKCANVQELDGSKIVTEAYEEAMNNLKWTNFPQLTQGLHAAVQRGPTVYCQTMRAFTINKDQELDSVLPGDDMSLCLLKKVEVEESESEGQVILPGLEVVSIEGMTDYGDIPEGVYLDEDILTYGVFRIFARQESEFKPSGQPLVPNIDLVQALVDNKIFSETDPEGDLKTTSRNINGVEMERLIIPKGMSILLTKEGTATTDVVQVATTDDILNHRGFKEIEVPTGEDAM
ncbi:hypothetical protein, partial [Litorimonas sp.]|uniref:hypothetical protein n=1 Tax=Litorimonas sp. TaxID=1892381 RepID=UPI003A88BF44